MWARTTIVKFAPNGNQSVYIPSGLDDPTGMAFDSSGDLFVADVHGENVKDFTPSGILSVFATNGIAGPEGIAFDSSGNLYVANSDNSTIGEFGTNGVGSVFASSGVNKPLFMAIQVPEPSTTLLVGIGMLTLWAGLRRKS